MKRQEKTFFVANLTEQLKSASALVLINYLGLSVKMQQDLKARLKEVGASFTVVKNTLFALAGKAAKIPEETLKDTVLQGPLALIITESDPIAPLYVLAKFAKEHETPQLKVGISEGTFQDKEDLTELSKLLSKNTLYSQVIGTIANPMYGLVSILEANLQKLIYIIQKYRTKKV